ncbi:MAG TPA: CARDB domain-containing protein, partial [Planctomycetaceae bacterium]|nr:CARDB domain-containing protein [Planctomycetaceae bacterium]
METRVLLSTVNWISNSSGFWDDPGNWQDRSTLANRVPDGSDDVLIDRGAGNPTITVRDNRTVRGLTDRETILITGGTLTVNGASQINGGKLTLNGRNLAANDTVLMTTTGKLDWKSGTIYGNGLQNSGTFTISATADVALAGTLTNSGLIQQSGTGNLVVNGTLNNALTGVFDFKTDAGIIGSNVINNSGVFRKTVGSGVSRIGPSASSSLYFNQLGGTLDAQSGTLQLDQTNTSVLETGGIWNASAGAILDFEGNTGSGTYFAGTFTGSGGGVVQLSSGRFGIDSSGATFNFPTGLLNWTGGAFFSQPLTNNGTITLSGVNDKALGSTLNNDGHLIMKGTGNLVMTSPLNNDPTGVIDFQSNSGISGNSSNAVINNQGTIKKSAGTGVSRIGPAANSVCYVNQLGGTLNALKGTLQLDQTSTSVTDTGGIWNASTGATLDFEGNVASGTYFAGTFTGSGGGVVQLSSGRFGIDSGGATFNFPAGLLQWSGGTFFSQPLTNTGVITLWGSDVKDLNNQLINTGTIIHSGTGDLVLGGGTVNNQASGLYDFRANVQIIGNSGTLNNSGILRKSAGSGESRLGTPDPNPGNSSFNFNNTGGTIDVQHGTINLASGGISTGGVFNAAAGGVLKITGNLAITGVYTGAGTGRIDFAGGSLLPCDTGIPGASATFNFPKGLFHWTGGEISGGISGIGIGSAAVLNNLGFISMDGPNTKSIRRNTIVNFGTIIDAGPGDLLLHGIDDFGTSAIDNRAGATFEFQGDALIDELPGNKGIFINAGTVKKTSGTGIAEIDGTFNSTAAGLIDVESGHLRLGNGGLFTGGAFNVAAGSVLEFGLASGYFTMLGTYTGSGLGSIDFQGGLSGGDDSTPAILNFAPGYFHMSGVWAGTVENDGWITLDGNRARAHIINVGTIVQTGPDDFNLNANTYFENRGLYDIQTVASLIVPNDGSGGNMRFFNTGTLRKSGGTGTSQLHHATTGNAFRLDNQGTVEVLSGTLEIDDPVVQLSGSKLTGGTWNVKHGATLTLPAGTNITTNQGNIVLDGTGATLTAIASLSANEGSLSLSGGVSFATVGNLSNSGTLVLGSHGTLKVNGDLTEVQTSAIQVQIAGTPTSHSFGNLVVAAEANLNGKLIVRLAEGFGPTAGNVYTVLGYGSKQGAFGVIAGLPPFFTANVNATSVRLNAGASAANIAVQSIVVPASATIGQHVPISYTVKNTTNIRINETWTDSIYLSKDTDFGPEDVLVARVPHTGGLAAFGSYQGTANAVLPNLTDGNYHVIVVADSSVNVPDTDRSDNTLASANEIQVHVPLLTLAVPFHGKIASHQESLYRINVPAGSGDLILNADFAAALEANVFIRYAGLPDSAHADASFLYQTSQHGQLVIANPQAGSYYVFVQGREGAATPKNFTLTARLAGLEIRGVSPSRGSNAGQTTITISGSGFSVRSAVALVSGGTTRNATSVLFKDSNTLFATFDLTGLAAGTFNVKVVDGVRNTTNAGVFTVVTGHFGVVTFDFVVPAVTRPGQAQTLLLNYTNTGDTDVPAPLFHITGDNAVFRLPEQPNFNSDSIEVLGINNQGPAGILPPGFRGQLSVIYLPVTSGAHVASNFTAAREDP